MKQKSALLLIMALAAALPLAAASTRETPKDEKGNPKPEEGTRIINLVQDDGQDRFDTRVYDLKNIKASDIGRYVEAAVRRVNRLSKVRMLNFSAARRQALIVSAPEKAFPMIDELVKMLDRGAKADEYGSKIKGAGYEWLVYRTRYRNPDALVYLGDLMGSSNTNVYGKNGEIWVRDSQGSMDYVMEWIKYLDRPVPQVKLTFKCYTIRESTLRDIGIDYLAWKNGPGMDLLSLAYSNGSLSWNKIFNTAQAFTSTGWSYGGIFTAPAFDFSFVRILQQSGNADVASTAAVTVTNNQESPATVSLAPTYNRIRKGENHQTSVQAFPYADMQVVIAKKPAICLFYNDKDLINDMGWVKSTPEFFNRNQGSIIFECSVYGRDAVEANNLGDQIGSAFQFNCSAKTIELGREQLLASTAKEYDVEQTIGVPFLCELPVLKYIFGTTTTMKETVHTFITVQADIALQDVFTEAGSKQPETQE